MGSYKPDWFPPVGTITEVVKALECNYILVKFPVEKCDYGITDGEIHTEERMCKESLFRKATKGEKFLYTINNGKIVIPKDEGEEE